MYEYNNKNLEIPISKALFGRVLEVRQQHEGQLAMNDGWWSYNYSSICYCHQHQAGPTYLLLFPPPPRFPQFFFHRYTNKHHSFSRHPTCTAETHSLHHFTNKHRQRHPKQTQHKNKPSLSVSPHRSRECTASPSPPFSSP